MCILTLLKCQLGQLDSALAMSLVSEIKSQKKCLNMQLLYIAHHKKIMQKIAVKYDYI